MKWTEIIGSRFSEERVALFEAEVEYLEDRGYVKKDLVSFLESHAWPVGVFDVLSMFMRSKLGVKDLEESLFFLYNRHVMIADILSRHLDQKSRVLDVGCGRGLVSCSLALRGFEVYGVDVSEDYMEVAKKLADRLHCEPGFRVMKEGELPFPAGYFDAVVCVWTLHEVSSSQMPKLFLELRRALREKGSVFIMDQEGVAPFEKIRELMGEVGFRLEIEKRLSRVYDHGRSSYCVMLKFGKEL